jgi:hypothetical protein
MIREAVRSTHGSAGKQRKERLWNLVQSRLRQRQFRAKMDDMRVLIDCFKIWLPTRFQLSRCPFPCL